jgi:hypothetical protein
MRYLVVVAMMGLALVGCGGSIGTPSVIGQPVTCGASAAVQLKQPAAPDYGYGSGPAYLSGQTYWYSGGQAAILMVDPKYAGPLSIRAYPLGTDSTSKITLDQENLSPDALAGLVEKERQHSVQVVSAQPTAGSLELAAVTPSHLWRGWFGHLSTTGPGCYAIEAKGTSFSEVIVVPVQGGSPPPG